jgi:hypothetical protein
MDHKYLSLRPLTPTFGTRDRLRQVENLTEQEVTAVTQNLEVHNAYHKFYLTLYHNHHSLPKNDTTVSLPA